MMELVAYIKTHGPAMVTLTYVLLLAGDLIVSLTPTKKDDLFMEMVAKFHRKVLSFTGLPNVKREGGSIIIPQGLGKHEKKASE